jgi:sarcosine oxidase
VWDAIVVGVGVMGAAALRSLAARGRRVLGIERFDVPHSMGSSSGGTRVIRRAYFEHPDYVPLLERSWTEWQAIERRVGETLLVKTGVLHFGPGEGIGMGAVRESARVHSLALEELDAGAIARRFPAFRPDAEDVGVFETEGGALLAERCVIALAQLAMEAGAEIHARERVIGVDVRGDRVEIATERGRYECAKLVLACGAWSEGDACPLPIGIPLVVERQVQLWLAPAAPAACEPEAMPVFIRFGPGGAFYGLPRIALPGVKVCEHHGGARVRAESVDRDVHRADEERVRAFVRAHLPAADGPLLGARVCMYTNTPDEHFAIGPHPGAPERVVIACGFSGHGFKLAPVVGELVADHAEEERAPFPRFDPARFAS